MATPRRRPRCPSGAAPDVRAMYELLGDAIVCQYETCFARVRITPELARHLLAFNTRNRTLRHQLVSMLVDEVSNKEWSYEIGMVLLSSNSQGHPEILDGQHRLEAIAQCDETVEVQVRWGLPPELLGKIDTGARRNGGDLCRLEGLPHPTLTAAISARLIVWEQTGEVLMGMRPMPHVQLAYARAHFGELQFAWELAFAIHRSIRIPPSEAGVTVILCRRAMLEGHDPEVADTVAVAFAHSLIYGDRPDGAVSALRDRLLLNAREGGRSSRLDAEERWRLIARTWNGWLRNAPRGSVHLRARVPSLAVPDDDELATLVERLGLEMP